MKKLLIASAALALSSTFAFADYRHPSTPSISFTTGNNWSKISNTVVGNKFADVTIVNAVNQNTGAQIPVTIIAPVGPLSGGLN